MKRLASALILLFAILGTAHADIQSPPEKWDGPTRKLSRGIANIALGSTELPVTWSKTLRREGPNAAASLGVVEGVKKTVVRFGYGVFEVVTFPFPAYKGGYKDPLYRDAKIYPFRGYSEFPPVFGWSSSNWTRRQID